MLRGLSVFFVLRSPKLNTVLEVQLYQCWIMDDHVPALILTLFLIQARIPLAFLAIWACCCLMFSWVLTNTPMYISSTVFQPLCSKPVALPEVFIVFPYRWAVIANDSDTVGVKWALFQCLNWNTFLSLKKCNSSGLLKGFFFFLRVYLFLFTVSHALIQAYDLGHIFFSKLKRYRKTCNGLGFLHLSFFFF